MVGLLSCLAFHAGKDKENAHSTTRTACVLAKELATRQRDHVFFCVSGFFADPDAGFKSPEPDPSIYKIILSKLWF